MRVYKPCGFCGTCTMQVNYTSSATGAQCTACGRWTEHWWGEGAIRTKTAPAEKGDESK